MIVEIRSSKNDQYYFVTMADNNKVLTKSEEYTSKQACRTGINALVKGVRSGVSIEDHSGTKPAKKAKKDDA